MRAVLLVTALSLAPSQASTPAALPVDGTCSQYASTHILVRHDVLARLEAADSNLPKAEAALAQAQEDLRALKAAADELQRQKGVLEGHIGLLEKTLDLQRKACASSELAGLAHATWEAVDATVGFVAGAGMCVGMVWGLNQVSRN